MIGIIIVLSDSSTINIDPSNCLLSALNDVTEAIHESRIPLSVGFYRSILQDFVIPCGILNSNNSTFY